MDPSTGTRGDGSVAGGKASAGDPFAGIPVELRKAVFDDLDDRRDVFAISRASPAMRKTARRNDNLIEQVLETELGLAQLQALLHDALAVVTFPATVWTASDADKKAVILQHLRDWQSDSVKDRAGDEDKMAAYSFIERFAVPFAEDFAALTAATGHADNQIRLPRWAHYRRSGRAPRPAMKIWRYEPEERVRLLRAFCRFELLSKVIRARPGAQLYTLDEQRRLLADLFDAWEVEEILCVQLYVGDMHTILLETHVVDVLETMMVNSVISRRTGYARGCQLVRLRRGPFEDDDEIDEDDDSDESDSESEVSSLLTVELIENSNPGPPTQNDSEGSEANTESASEAFSDYEDTDDEADDDETDWFTKTGTEADPGTPCAKFELAGHEKHAIFVKQTATFGLAFLKHFVQADEKTYSRWIRANGHVLLDGAADPDEAEYFGPLGARDRGAAWLAPRLLDPAQLDGDSTAASDPPSTNADLAHGRSGPGAREDAAANTAWKHLDATNPQLREAFRRCGWVFWSDARLRRNVFWNRRIDVFAPAAAPAWLYRPERDDNDDNDDGGDDDGEPDYFLSRYEIDARMASAVGGAALLLGLGSAAEAKLLAFLGQNLARRGSALFGEHPFDGLRHERIPLDVWEECVGGADPAAPAGTVQVFRDIFWG